MEIITLNLGENSYQIAVGQGLLEKAGELAQQHLKNPKEAFILTNTTVGPLYGETLQKSLEKAGIKTWLYSVEDGEDYKNLTVLSELYDALVEAGLERSGSLWTLGGGVVGDLGGFAAATYLRGIQLVQVPTSLLAQVDSSVGGKVAVNHTEGKNLIGSFYQPSFVLADLAALKTLPLREWRVGFAEIVKYALLAGGAIYQLLKARRQEIVAQDPLLIQKLVVESIKIKAQVVAQDEREQGQRINLNLGHTIAHGLEAATDYRVFRHGEAVAIGLVGAMEYAFSVGKFPGDAKEEFTAMIEELGLPLKVPREVQKPGLATEVLAHLSHDKKVRAGKIRFVLPVAIGKVEIVELTSGDLAKVVLSLCGEEEA